jgi:hypothetical protein
MSGVPANLAAELHPGPPTEYVGVALYGGPQDGLPVPVVPSVYLRGVCHAAGFTGPTNCLVSIARATSTTRSMSGRE